MENILICGYRDWSRKLFFNVDRCVVDNIIYVDDKKMLSEKIEEYEPTYIFFIGWSWIIEDEIINNYPCICLHPSPLPKYRGGSPIQHQIINGETESAVSLFRMNSGVDTGEILYQEQFSLDGNLKDIFKKIIDVGTFGVIYIIENRVLFGDKQDESQATLFKRRKPSMSEIKIEDFANKTAEQLYNKIRALQDPYPNAFVRCKGGKKLYLIESNLGVNSYE